MWHCVNAQTKIAIHKIMLMVVAVLMNDDYCCVFYGILKCFHLSSLCSFWLRYNFDEHQFWLNRFVLAFNAFFSLPIFTNIGEIVTAIYLSANVIKCHGSTAPDTQWTIYVDSVVGNCLQEKIVGITTLMDQWKMLTSLYQVDTVAINCFYAFIIQSL